MKISGLQKLTLLDYPTQTACTVFLSGCNFLCPFCHNSTLINSNVGIISEEEFFNFLDKRKKLLDGVCVSGGEPLLSAQVGDFIKRIKEKGYKVKLDTNGSFPDRLGDLIDRGLIDYCAMDVKNSPSKYALSVGKTNFDIASVCESVELLKKGKVDYEFRTTVARELHEKEDFYEIGKWLSGAKNYFLQKYKESDDVLKKCFTAYSDEEMRVFLSVAGEYVQNSGIRG